MTLDYAMKHGAPQMVLVNGTEPFTGGLLP
jgi:hypothetical protein